MELISGQFKNRGIMEKNMDIIGILSAPFGGWESLEKAFLSVGMSFRAPSCSWKFQCKVSFLHF